MPDLPDIIQETCAETVDSVRQWYRSRYPFASPRQQEIHEKYVRQFCERERIPYTPPLDVIRYDKEPQQFWAMQEEA